MAEVSGTNGISVELVEGWLQAMNCQFNRAPTPETNWLLEVQFPVGSNHRINIFNPTNQSKALAIVTGVGLAQDYTDGIGKLSAEQQKEFRWELVKALSSGDVEFNLKETPDGRPQGFEIMATRYIDGLTMDAFARSVFAVYKTEILAINCFRRFV